MANTRSLAFPNMFDTARNTVSVLDDAASVVNRNRLLFLTEPTELYNSPNFGVGLKRYLWHYNNENTKALMKDRIVEQLRQYEPYVEPDKTQFADNSLLFTGTLNNPLSSAQEYNKLKMTVGLKMIFGDSLEVDLTDYAVELLKSSNS